MKKLVLFTASMFLLQAAATMEQYHKSVNNLDCKKDLFEYPNRDEYGFVNHFALCWNNAHYDLMEVKGRCKKPDIKGWTQDESAKSYVECSRKNRKEHNQKVKILNRLARYKRELQPSLDKYNINTENW